MSIENITNAILQLVPAGCAMRLIFLAISLAMNQDEADSIKKKIKNTLKFAVIASSVFVIKTLVASYYS